MKLHFCKNDLQILPVLGDSSCAGFKCGTTSECITNTTKLCDGYNDCGAYEDEKKCKNVKFDND